MGLSIVRNFSIKIESKALYSARSRNFRQMRIVMARGGVEDTRLEAKAKDTKNFRGQGQNLSSPRPRTKDTGASVFLKKRSSKIFFRRSPKKGLQKNFSGEKGLQKFFSGDLHLRKTKKGLRKFSARFLAFSHKISTVQKIVLSSSRGQGNFRGLEASRPRTSKCVLEAKDVLKDSTSDNGTTKFEN